MSVDESDQLAQSRIVSILTPPGRAAIATVAAWGDNVSEVAEKYFRGRLAGGREQRYPRHRFGHWVTDGYREEVVVGLIDSNHLEVHCHGGMVPCRTLVDCFVAHGFREVDWDQTVALESADLIAEEAQIDMAKASTERVAWILFDQWQGAWQRWTGKIHDAIVKGRWAQACQDVDNILKRRDVGMHLIEPWIIVIGGPANVGKSSLMNRLLGYARSIVFDQPGTTRDVLKARSALDGWPVELRDTAGMRATDDRTEQAGIALAEAAGKEADLLIWLRDLSSSIVEKGEVPFHKRLITVGNKKDLPAPSNEVKQPECDIEISAKTGEGVADLIEMMVARLVVTTPESGAAIPFRPRHIAALEQLAANLALQDAALATHSLSQFIGRAL